MSQACKMHRFVGARKGNWTQLLLDCVEAARTVPFAWGHHDCCLFVADVVFAMTDVDPAAGLRGTYRSETGAQRLLKRHGGVIGLATHMGQRIGAPQCRVREAGRGDVVALDYRGNVLLGVVIDDRVAAVGRDGLVFLSIDYAVSAWKI